MSLLLISFPRIYVGGHYPVDVLFSCFLAVLMRFVVWRRPVLSTISNCLPLQKLPVVVQELIFFLWVFEFGEGFRGVELLAGVVHHAMVR
jgi:hypothetical protein